MSTLATYKRRPATRLHGELKNVPASFFSERSNHVNAMLVENGPEKAVPENEAIWFYLTNAAMARVRERVSDHEPLGKFEPFVKDYYERLNVSALRMFYYLLWICTRESRHTHSKSYYRIKDAYGDDRGIKYLSMIPSSSSGAVAFFKANPPPMTIGEYTHHLVVTFSVGGFSHGYGGKAWANVAKCLDQYVQGNTTVEMMMDTAFTLAHNNGPIFNKGMLYTHYDSQQIIRILDAQRAGMIPQLVDSKASTFVKQDHCEYRKNFAELVPDFGGEIDWAIVKKLGAVGKYEKDVVKPMSPKPVSYPNAKVVGKYEVDVTPAGVVTAVDLLKVKREKS